jgi:regulator of protease activity HflC (stomatin/prohibitin superfamily)
MFNELLILGAGLLGVIMVTLGATMVFEVAPHRTATVERRGRVLRRVGPGLHLKVPFLDRMVSEPEAPPQHLDVTVEAKARDSVDVQVTLRIHYCVVPQEDCDAFYHLEHANRQLALFASDTLRASLAQLTFLEARRSKASLANRVRKELSQVMKGFGFSILGVVVTDVTSSTAPIADAPGFARKAIAVVAGLRGSLRNNHRSPTTVSREPVMHRMIKAEYFQLLNTMRTTPARTPSHAHFRWRSPTSSRPLRSRRAPV